MARPMGDAILALLVAFVGAGFIWEGIWGLRGRDLYASVEVIRSEPLRGRAARWAGVVLLAFGILFLGLAVRLALRIWR